MYVMTALTNKFEVNRSKKFENLDTLARSLLLLILSITFGSNGSPAYEEIQTDNSRSYKILELSYIVYLLSGSSLEGPVYLGLVVQKVDNAIQWINLYPVDSAIDFPNTHPLDSDLSDGQRYPTFEQPGPTCFIGVTRLSLI